MPDITQAAIDAVGAKRPQDWSLHPETHAESLTPAAGSLQRILRRGDFEELIAVYNAADTDAISAQKTYKLLSGWSAALSFLAVVFTGCLLIGYGFAGPDTASWLPLLSKVTGACIVVSFLLSLIVGGLNPFRRWMENRALAEYQRIRLFNKVLDVTDESPRDAAELALLPLQLEYLRRFQLDVQLLYYGKRGRQHGRTVRIALMLRGLAMLLVLLAGVPVIASLTAIAWENWPWVTDLLGGAKLTLEQEHRLFAGLGSIGAALQGLLAARLLMGQDERNSARYAATHSNLMALAGRPLDEARTAAASGDRERVLTFAALLQEQISSEHREWVNLKAISPELSLRGLANLTLPKLG